MTETKINRKQEIERLEDELMENERGHTAWIEIAPAGGDGNIEWNAAAIEVVKIDDDTILHRYNDDSINTDWSIGTVEQAVDEAIEEIRRQDESEKKDIDNFEA